MKILDIPEIFKSDADDIIQSRSNALRIHGTNIRSAGAEVELSVRNYLERMLPPRYYVSQGHLLDKFGNASPQLDVILSDNFNLPSLMTTKDGTKYVPIDSVYSVGEIKSTYYKSQHPIESFSETIQDIKDNLYHQKIINTAYEGINDNTLLRDVVLEKGNRVLNRIFFFIIFIHSGDFKFEDISSFYINQNNDFLPNIAVILDKGVILRGYSTDEAFKINRYPEDEKDKQEDWYFCPFQGIDSSSLEGNHLGFLYYSLVEHLANSYLEPPTLKDYLLKFFIGHKSLLKKANKASIITKK